jgi:hypothetical protein
MGERYISRCRLLMKFDARSGAGNFFFHRLNAPEAHIADSAASDTE